MSSTSVFAKKPTCASILKSLNSSQKRHLLLSGSKGSGKSTLLKELVTDMPGITTWAIPKDKVLLSDGSQTVTIGIFDPSVSESDGRMRPVHQGFLEATEMIRQLMDRPEEEVFIDEIGYLEENEAEYLEALSQLLTSKRCYLVLRKGKNSHLEQLKQRDDVLYIDLDEPYGHVGAAILASGVSKRFAGNKLLVEYKGKPLIASIYTRVENLFSERVIVSRSSEIKMMYPKYCILHDLPYKNESVALATEALEDKVDAIMYLQADQPEVKEDTILAFLILAKNYPEMILRLQYQNTPSAPVLFPKKYFAELRNLPQDQGGNTLARRYPNLYVVTEDEKEVMDIDTKEDLERLGSMVE